MKTVEEWTLDPSTVKLLNLGRKMVGHVIRCLSGTLWVTQEGDARDHILGPGEEFAIESTGVVVVRRSPPRSSSSGPAARRRRWNASCSTATAAPPERVADSGSVG